MQVEGWLEPRRQRGYSEGGSTTEGSTPAAGGQLMQRDASTATESRILQVLESLDQRFQGVEQWATTLEVVQDLFGLDRDLEKAKKVKQRGEIRPQ
jgi:hypothetical protein